MENPPKVNRTVPYRAVPCSGKAPSVGSRNGAGSGADSVGSRNGAGSGADSVGSRNGAGSVGSRNGAGSGADSVGSRNGAGSGADSILKAEPLKLIFQPKCAFFGAGEVAAEIGPFVACAAVEAGEAGAAEEAFYMG